MEKLHARDMAKWRKQYVMGVWNVSQRYRTTAETSRRQACTKMSMKYQDATTVAGLLLFMGNRAHQIIPVPAVAHAHHVQRVCAHSSTFCL